MKKIILSLFLMALTVSLAFAQRKTTVSVMDFNATSGLSAKELALLTDKLLNSLVEFRVFEVVERSKRDEILREQGFQMTGACSEASCLVEVGQLLGAQKMIGGTIGQLGSIYAVELRMIDIGSGGIDLSFSRNYGKVADLLTAMREAAEIFSSWKPGSGLSAKPGGLFVVTEPDGAKIMVDGQEYKGLTPQLIFPLPEGLHQVSLVKDGYSLYSASRLVSVGKVDTLNVPMMSMAGKLKLTASPTGARLYLNGKYQGTTTPQPMTVEDLADSAYALRLQKWGYRTLQERLVPASGRETRMNVGLPLSRWTINWGFNLVNGLGSGEEETLTLDPVDATPQGPISVEELKAGNALGGNAGVGFAIHRNLTLNAMYQFRVYPHIIDIGGALNNTNWPQATTDRVQMTLTAHSLLGGVCVNFPVGRLEPYLEFRYGGFGCKSDGEFERDYQTWSDSLNTFITDSTYSASWNQPVTYITRQMGGGIKLWLHPHRPNLRVYCMYNRDSFGIIPQPLDYEKLYVTISGLLLGAGLSLNF